MTRNFAIRIYNNSYYSFFNLKYIMYKFTIG